MPPPLCDKGEDAQSHGTTGPKLSSVYSGFVSGGSLMPVQEEPRLATCKQPMRDGTKRGVTLFMEFLLYLLVVVASDAITSMCIKVFLAYREIPPCLEALVREPYVITPA